MGERTPPRWQQALVTTVTLGLTAAVLTWFFAQFTQLNHWGLLLPYRRLFLEGWLTTLGLALAALVGSAVVGALTCLLRACRWTALRGLATGYVELIRATPLLVQLLLFFYVVADALHVENRYIVGVFALICFSGAYVSEILRAAWLSIPQGQHESARSLGLTPWQSLRHVIAPQALRIALPSLTGQLMSLIKDSSLLSVIGITELTFQAQAVNSFTYSTLECYVPLAVGYLLLTWPLAWVSSRLERRFHHAS
jgi:polar amino acid transport system permease protein